MDRLKLEIFTPWLIFLFLWWLSVPLCKPSEILSVTKIFH